MGDPGNFYGKEDDWIEPRDATDMKYVEAVNMLAAEVMQQYRPVRWKGEVYVYREGRWTGGDDAEAMMDQHIRERYYALGLNGKFVMPVLGGSVKAQV
ncbi:MAG: hypothetical protein ACP5ME_15225, partial [Anaerolineae bacterium]